MKYSAEKMPTGLLIDFIASQGAKRAVEELAALCQDAYGQRSDSVPISKLLELARRYQYAADGHYRMLLGFLEINYGSPVVLDGNADTVTFPGRRRGDPPVCIEVTGRIPLDD